MIRKQLLTVLMILSAATVAACLIYPMAGYGVTHWTNWTYPPVRVFRRVWMISVILAIILARKPLGMGTPAQAGFRLSKNGWRNLFIGLFILTTFLGVLSLFYLGMGGWKAVSPFPSPRFFKKFFEGCLRGMVVSGLEEYIFRGLIFFSLCRRWNWLKAAVFTSLIFASLHFLEGRGQENVFYIAEWNTGFRICGLLLGNMAREFTLFPDALGLFIIGMALCHAAYRTGSLWYGAALHGGWIAFFSFRSTLFTLTGTISEFWLGGTRLFDGIIPMLCIASIFPVTAWLVHKKILASER